MYPRDKQLITSRGLSLDEFQVFIFTMASFRWSQYPSSGLFMIHFLACSFCGLRLTINQFASKQPDSLVA